MKRSEAINELATALAKAQGEFRTALKDSSAKISSQKGEGASYSYKFADLASIVDASRAALSLNGLAVLQPPEATVDGQITVNTLLTHSSGQWLSSQMVINYVGGDLKKIGSAITYMRRYAYASMVGIVTDDDDGSDAPAVEARARQPEKPRREPAGEGTPSRESINREFAPAGQADAPKPGRPANDREKTKLRGDRIGAKGLDVRNWVKLVSDEVEGLNKTVAGYRVENKLDAREAINSFQVGNHCFRVAIEAGSEDPRERDAEGKPKQPGPGKVGAYLANLYLDAEWREWLRVEVKEYLKQKARDAYQVAENEIYGDPPLAEEGAARPKGQLVGATASDPDDDAFEPGRE